MMNEETLKEALLEAQEYLTSQFPTPTEEDHKFSLRFRLKMKRLIEKDKSPVRYYIRRTAAIVFLVLGISGFLVLGLNEEVRAEVWGWILERIGDNAFRYQNHMSEEIDVSQYTLEGNVPNEYQLFDRYENAEMLTEIYVDDAGHMLTFSVMSPGYDTSIYVFSDEDKVEEPVSIGELAADLYLSKDPGEASMITWQAGNGVRFMIQGVFSEEQLIRLAEKIK